MKETTYIKYFILCISVGAVNRIVNKKHLLKRYLFCNRVQDA